MNQKVPKLPVKTRRLYGLMGITVVIAYFVIPVILKKFHLPPGLSEALINLVVILILIFFFMIVRNLYILHQQKKGKALDKKIW